MACGRSRRKQELLRIVKSANDEIKIDIGQRLPGRGAYICPTPECARLARQTHGLERSLRHRIADDFYRQLLREVSACEC
ncbi:MAG: YlxR family protein [candidate division KSB1 bacterium]|nr:YlxR family protein [candidate division KSB1 bacterium]MDZ7341410.1 YlxR family protein [candidate division KSB1 bacterium]